MAACSQCGAALYGAGNFCSTCGAKTRRPAAGFLPEPPITQHHVISNGADGPRRPKGFGQIFGLDPRITFLTFLLDWMLFGVEGMSFFTSVVYVSVPAGAVLAFIAYKAQMKWYGDDHDSALIKGCILGLLTAIPTPLPSFLYVPAGIVGLFHGMGQRLIGKRTT